MKVVNGTSILPVLIIPLEENIPPSCGRNRPVFYLYTPFPASLKVID
jgi:hypothetical protein